MNSLVPPPLVHFRFFFWGGGGGWALINFSFLQDGRLFKVGAYSRLGALSNEYGS